MPTISDYIEREGNHWGDFKWSRRDKAYVCKYAGNALVKVDRIPSNRYTKPILVRDSDGKVSGMRVWDKLTKTKIPLSWVILGVTAHSFEAGFEVDHKDGDPCNNRLNNLRIVTKSENNLNRVDNTDYRWVSAIQPTQRNKYIRYLVSHKYTNKTVHYIITKDYDLACVISDIVYDMVVVSKMNPYYVKEIIKLNYSPMYRLKTKKAKDL